jgi:cell wall-associated NlpC family hydrolase
MARKGFRRALTACVVAAALAGLAAPASADARYAARTISHGATGSDVKHLQRYLTKAGFRTTIDGHYGRRSAAAQKRFERSQRRRADGRATRGEQRLVQRVARKRRAPQQNAAQPPPQQPNSTDKAVIGPDGRTAIAPESAPQQVKDAIAAANRITRKPYRYGGGHGSFEDSGYDCSGAVSYALRGAGLISRPMDSRELMRWGSAGAGEWITVYSNPDHAYVVIAGLRFDTSRAYSKKTTESGPRWRDTQRPASGYTARHPAGL